MLFIGSREFPQNPPLGLAMGGYMDRNGPSIGSHDELMVRVVCFVDEEPAADLAEQQGNSLDSAVPSRPYPVSTASSGSPESTTPARPLFLVSCDLVGTPMEWREEVACALEVVLGVPVDVVITATHTHSGPDVRADGEAESAFAYSLLERIVHACIEAYESRSVCTRSEVGSAMVDGVGSIRRIGGAVSVPLTLQLFYTGGAAGTAEALGAEGDEGASAQAEAPVVEADAPVAEADAPSIVIANFQCHPTVLSASNRNYSADYPGVLVRHLKQKFGEQTTVCFFNGACGDISTRFTRREQTFAEVERIGGLVAAGADMALAAPRRITATDVRIHVATRSVELEPQAPDENVIAELRRRVAAPLAPVAGLGVERIRRTQAQALEVLERRTSEQMKPQTVELTAVSFPGLTSYVFWPGEPFSGYAEALRAGTLRAETLRAGTQTAAARRTDRRLLVGYAGYIGYLPDVSPAEDPSYEVLMSEYGRTGGKALLATSEDLLRTTEISKLQEVES